MVLGIGFLLLVSLVVSAAISAIGAWLSGLLPLPEVVLQGINLVVSIAVVALLFAMIFRFLPDVEIGWRDVQVGAVFTAVLFGLGKLAIGLYVGKSSVSSGYGRTAGRGTGPLARLPAVFLPARSRRQPGTHRHAEDILARLASGSPPSGRRLRR